MPNLNLDKLVSRYCHHEKIQALNEALGGDSLTSIQIKGSMGGHIAFLIASLYKIQRKPQIIIEEDLEKARYLFDSLFAILPKEEILFLPDSFKRPRKFDALSKNNMDRRTETINKISVKNNFLIVTYPEALFERVLNPKILNDNSLEISKGETLDIDTIINILVDFGFKREDFVYEPGQFSVRGGIVDIFSFGNGMPYRIELFDDEIESIRTFNPASQLSIKQVSYLRILPNINDANQQHERTDLWNVFPKNLNVWIRDPEFMLDRIQDCFEGIEAFRDQHISFEEEDELRLFFDAKPFSPTHTILDGLRQFNVCLFNSKKFDFKIDKEIVFKTNPQPVFNKNFKLLIEDIEKNDSEGIQTYIFTENTRQLERFDAILTDLEAKSGFEPVPIDIFEGFVDKDLSIACYTDHQIFNRFYRYKSKQGFTKDQALHLKMLKSLVRGDFITHIDHGVGQYSGLEKLEIKGRVQESVRIIYKNNDVLYVGIQSLHKISKYVGKDGTAPKLNKLGSDAWQTVKNRTKRKIKDIARELIKLYAQRRAAEGFAFPEDGYLQNELEASFLYEDTPDQYQATVDVKNDMQSLTPMDRLICGDVGFGKTEIAVRAAFKSIVGGKQVAVLVPTTILALQHYRTFKERLEEFGVTVDYINRFKTTKEKNEIFENLKKGTINLVIGTHGLLNKKIAFKDLGLLIVDEEQKFGVAAKEKLRTLKVNVDTLTLTATPIPRTLQFSLMAARDMSIIRTPPPNRQPIHTEIRIFNEKLIQEAIYFEVNRGGQVFFVHNRVKTLPEVNAMIKRMCPDLDVRMAHGQMEARDLEKALLDFIEYKFEVLTCTNIIETGLDISNANTIIINNAHQFGLSDLHQLRGRVGRSNKKAFCYLFCPPMSTITADARKRLKTIEDFSDLGSGFDVAMRDLDIRGAGNLLGGEQSGFISDIGYDAYQKILEEAIIELKESEFKEVFDAEQPSVKSYVKDVELETDIEMLIPDNYVSNIGERLRLYTQLNELETETDVEQFQEQLEDRFGKLPKPVKEMITGLRIQWLCRSMGFERVILKNEKLKLIFIANPQSPFYETPHFRNLLHFIGSKGGSLGFAAKQSTKYFMFVKENVKSLKHTLQALELLHAHQLADV